ncbi:RHTO0S06e02410g1_1 [Rhodotorula toruloides]|uniref:RHTO0S06e02410g1_1 n=1 Tax=Rhodotorula toruloides TaxID=5286 RepID=A0A061B3F1_RHOTO|nr:RHTO0S06e02410g1_1 [Rhodotorula toruloides]
MTASTPNLRSLLALASLLVAVASAQPGRFPCGVAVPNQRACDALSHPTARRGLLVPIDSECVAAGQSGYFCGWAGARCTSDLQCDFGYCSGTDDEPGQCIGGLGDSCEGPGGPDDSLCAGNLGCQVEGAVGKAVCGGQGADCSFHGSYKPSTKPNHHACLSGFCNPQSLTCSTKVLDSAQELKAQPAVQLPPPRQQQRFSPDSDNEGPAHRRRVALPAGATCPQGFSVCPVSRRRGDQEKHYLACFDTTSSATQCGGCSNSDGGLRGQAPEGIDCTALPGVANGGSAACIESKCRIFSCAPGYDFEQEEGACVLQRYW